MSPDYLIEVAMDAYAEASGQSVSRPWMEAAFNAVAADIWDDGYVAGVESAHEFFAGENNADTPNPYRASEDA